MDCSLLFDRKNFKWPIVYIERSQGIISKQNCISFSEDRFCLSKWHYAVFHLGLHCLPKHTFRSHNLGNISYFCCCLLTVFKINFFQKIRTTFVIANSADHVEIPHYVAFHLSLYCLPNNALRSQ